MLSRCFKYQLNKADNSGIRFEIVLLIMPGNCILACFQKKANITQ